jgi:hypothetical protein
MASKRSSMMRGTSSSSSTSVRQHRPPANLFSLSLSLSLSLLVSGAILQHSSSYYESCVFDFKRFVRTTWQHPGTYIYEFFRLAYTHQVKLDHNFVCVAMAIKVMEGLAIALDPKLGAIDFRSVLSGSQAIRLFHLLCAVIACASYWLTLLACVRACVRAVLQT